MSVTIRRRLLPSLHVNDDSVVIGRRVSIEGFLVGHDRVGLLLARTLVVVVMVLVIVDSLGRHGLVWIEVLSIWLVDVLKL